MKQDRIMVTLLRSKDNAATQRGKVLFCEKRGKF